MAPSFHYSKLWHKQHNGTMFRLWMWLVHCRKQKVLSSLAKSSPWQPSSCNKLRIKWFIYWQPLSWRMRWDIGVTDWSAITCIASQWSVLFTSNVQAPCEWLYRLSHNNTIHPSPDVAYQQERPNTNYKVCNIRKVGNRGQINPAVQKEDKYTI